MLETLTHADFAQHVNTKFRMRLPSDTALEIELIQAEEYTSAPHQERFTLSFLAPLEAPAQQGIYQIEHEQLGTGGLFLVPTSRDESGLCYEAVFNRRRKVEK
ncbi:MAG: hypothetical protein ABI977_02635 [Acidobacteriota bacterium]